MKGVEELRKHRRIHLSPEPSPRDTLLANMCAFSGHKLLKETFLSLSLFSFFFPTIFQNGWR